MEGINVFWFRRDLRLKDNAGLYHALKQGHPVMPVFIFDTEILDKLPSRRDARVEFIHRALLAMDRELRELGSCLRVMHGKPAEVWQRLIAENRINAVFTNRDHEPYALKRDAAVRKVLEDNGSGFHTFKDHCIFEFDEVLKDDGTPYTVFTPYSRKWKEKLNRFYLSAYPCEKYFHHFLPGNQGVIPTPGELGFEETGISFPPQTVSTERIRSYAQTRNIPAIDGSSRLSVHFRFGTVSIREKARKAMTLSNEWLNELIWRDFYLQIMAHFPHAMNAAFKPAYDRIPWRNDEKEFDAWCRGETGYPIVDAGMRELNATGFMHNRVRMITASFLCKHLLTDWRWGAAYFAEKLLDFDLASNNGGWQWAAGSGTDAAPYFRIFNPYLQTEKFDPDLVYVRKWVPEYGSTGYPKPIVEHAFARERCLAVYKEALNAV